MTSEEKFALNQAILNLELKIETMLKKIRKELLGHGQRAILKDIQFQIKTIKDFVNGEP